jgi:hypothetical protein
MPITRIGPDQPRRNVRRCGLIPGARRVSQERCRSARDGYARVKLRGDLDYATTIEHAEARQEVTDP